MPDRAARPPSVVDVLVVGGGPAGLTVASLLGTYGLRVTLVEKNHGTSDEAKAISLDDESLRALQVAGLDEAVYPIIVPGTGTHYYDRRGRPLFHARGPEVRRHGHPFKNPFAQPDLERVLCTGVAAIENVDTCFGTELVGFTQSRDAVTAKVRTHDGEITAVTAQFMLGCDGGRSTVREQLGIEMSGRSFPDLWLVADTLEDTHDERYGMHVGDPDRPHVIVPGLNGRCRYEFKLKPGEATAGSNPPFELVQRLVGRYRSLAPDQLERSVVYGFHAIIANAFREGRCFLLGDAAHMMPPFAGQGLNSGVRDAFNLAWKVAAVVNGRANDRLLDTYEDERRPHAQATIDLSVRLGEVVMTSSRARARARDVAVRTALRLPRTRQYLTEMRYRPKAQFTKGFLAPAPKAAIEAVVGTAVPQTQVLDGSTNTVHRLDDLLGTGGALIGVSVDDTAWEQVDKALAELGELDGSGITALFGARIALALDDRSPRPTRDRVSIADVDGALERHLSPARGHFVLVRPDRVVAAAFLPAHTADAVQALSAYTTASPPEGRREPPLRPQPEGLLMRLASVTVDSVPYAARVEDGALRAPPLRQRRRPARRARLGEARGHGRQGHRRRPGRARDPRAPPQQDHLPRPELRQPHRRDGPPHPGVPDPVRQVRRRAHRPNRRRHAPPGRRTRWTGRPSWAWSSADLAGTSLPTTPSTWSRATPS